jgi:hypothetical protein
MQQKFFFAESFEIGSGCWIQLIWCIASLEIHKREIVGCQCWCVSIRGRATLISRGWLAGAGSLYPIRNALLGSLPFCCAQMQKTQKMTSFGQSDFICSFRAIFLPYRVGR